MDLDNHPHPYFEHKDDDPLRLLARLPLPIYITTSYYSALEKLIIEGGSEVDAPLFLEQLNLKIDKWIKENVPGYRS